MRSRIVAVAAVAAALLAGCASPEPPGQTEPPGQADPSSPPPGFEDLVAALPTSNELPEGFVFAYQCPGGELCVDIEDADDASINADGATDPGDGWMSSYFAVAVAHYPDAAAAQAAFDVFRERAAEHEGDFDIAPEPLAEGFVPGERGTGSVRDRSEAGWTGLESLDLLVYRAPDDVDVSESEPRQRAQIMLVNERATVLCISLRHAEEGERRSREDCRDAVADYVTRVTGEYGS